MNNNKLDKTIKDININSNSKYTVSFDSNGGSIIPAQVIEENRAFVSVYYWISNGELLTCRTWSGLEKINGGMVI